MPLRSRPAGSGGAFLVVEVALERDPREHAVEPGGQRPGAVAEQRHHRRGDHHAHHQHVDQDRGGEAEADRLDDHVGIGDEAEEDAGHDHAGREDDPAYARHRSHDALLRPRAAHVLLADARLQEDVVVHREAEQDREHEQRDEGHDRHLAVHAQQAGADSLLEDEHHDAVGRGDREQVERGGDERHPQRAEHRHQEQHAEPDDHGDEDRQPAGDLVGQVLERRRGAADVDVHLRAARGAGEHVVAQPVDQLGGALVLGRALRDHVQDRGVAARRGLRRGHEGHVAVLRHGLLDAVRVVLPEPSAGVVAARTSGPLKPGPKPSASRS